MKPSYRSRELRSCRNGADCTNKYSSYQHFETDAHEGNCQKRERLRRHQGVAKRCRLSWLTNSVLFYEPKCEGGMVAGSQPMSSAVQMEPK